jgi:hypothetical protein
MQCILAHPNLAYPNLAYLNLACPNRAYPNLAYPNLAYLDIVKYTYVRKPITFLSIGSTGNSTDKGG